MPTRDEIFEYACELTQPDLIDLLHDLLGYAYEAYGVDAEELRPMPLPAIVPLIGLPGDMPDVTTYYVFVTGVDQSKRVPVMKKLRELCGLDLLTAKHVIDNLPYPVQEEITEEYAQELAGMLEEAGCNVEVSGYGETKTSIEFTMRRCQT